MSRKNGVNGKRDKARRIDNDAKALLAAHDPAALLSDYQQDARTYAQARAALGAAWDAYDTALAAVRTTGRAIALAAACPHCGADYGDRCVYGPSGDLAEAKRTHADRQQAVAALYGVSPTWPDGSPQPARAQA